jgi:hypothetical protein
MKNKACESFFNILGVCGWMCVICIGIPYYFYKFFVYLHSILGNNLYYILGGIGLVLTLVGMVKVFLLAIKTDWEGFDDVSMRKSNGYQEPPNPIYARSEKFDGLESSNDRPSTPCPPFVSSSMPNHKKSQ